MLDVEHKEKQGYGGRADETSAPGIKEQIHDDLDVGYWGTYFCDIAVMTSECL